jgi:hypothetical protein
VRRRASSRCEYCLIHEDDSYARHQLDHITAVRHGGEKTWRWRASCATGTRAAMLPHSILQPAMSCACSIRDANSGGITSHCKAR